MVPTPRGDPGRLARGVYFLCIVFYRGLEVSLLARAYFPGIQHGEVRDPGLDRPICIYGRAKHNATLLYSFSIAKLLSVSTRGRVRQVHIHVPRSSYVHVL